MSQDNRPFKVRRREEKIRHFLPMAEMICKNTKPIAKVRRCKPIETNPIPKTEQLTLNRINYDKVCPLCCELFRFHANCPFCGVELVVVS